MKGLQGRQSTRGSWAWPSPGGMGGENLLSLLPRYRPRAWPNVSEADVPGLFGCCDDVRLLKPGMPSRCVLWPCAGSIQGVRPGCLLPVSFQVWQGDGSNAASLSVLNRRPEVRAPGSLQSEHPSEPLPPSPPPLLPAARSALTSTLPLTRVAWRKPTPQQVLCKCRSNCVLGGGKKRSGAWFYFRLWRSRKGPTPWGRGGHGDRRETTVTGRVGTYSLWGLAKGREKLGDGIWALTADEEVCQQISLQVSELKIWCTRKHERTRSVVFCINIKLHTNNVLSNLHFLVIHWCTQQETGSWPGLHGREPQVSGKGAPCKDDGKYSWRQPEHFSLRIFVCLNLNSRISMAGTNPMLLNCEAISQNCCSWR